MGKWICLLLSVLAAMCPARDLQDIAVLSGEWLTCRHEGYTPQADYDRSGCVDAADLAILAEEWLMSNYPYKINRTVGENTTIFHNKGGTPPLYSITPNYPIPPGGTIYSRQTISHGLHEEAEHPEGSPSGERWRILIYSFAMSVPPVVAYVGSDDPEIVLGNYVGVGEYQGLTAILTENTDPDPVLVRPSALVVSGISNPNAAGKYDHDTRWGNDTYVNQDSQIRLRWDILVSHWEIYDLLTDTTFNGPQDWYNPAGAYEAVYPATGTLTAEASTGSIRAIPNRIKLTLQDTTELILNYDFGAHYYSEPTDTYFVYWNDSTLRWACEKYTGESLEEEFTGPYQYYNNPFGDYVAVAPATGTVVVSVVSGDSAGLLSVRTAAGNARTMCGDGRTLQN